jgi:NTP pyrophosphatase (non-canonical NTP hydrolase)
MYKEKLAYNQSPERTSEIMTYEATNVMHEIIHADVYPKLKTQHLDNARKELGDLITQTLLLCEQMNWDWNKVADEGYMSFIDRMKDIRDNRKV